MLSAHVEIPTAQDKTQSMPSCEALIQESRCCSQATRASAYSYDSACTINDLFVGLMMATMIILLFMFSQNRREDSSISSSVAGVDYSDDIDDDGSFTDGTSGDNSSGSDYGGHNGGIDSSGVDGDTKDDGGDISGNISSASGGIFCYEMTLDEQSTMSSSINHRSVMYVSAILPGILQNCRSVTMSECSEITISRDGIVGFSNGISACSEIIVSRDGIVRLLQRNHRLASWHRERLTLH